MKDYISRQAAIDAIRTLSTWFCDSGAKFFDGPQPPMEALLDPNEVIKTIAGMPPAQPEWNNHKVACLLAELFNDTCACNYNGIDEWLPEKCELLDSCPNPVGVACWEQFLKHKAKRRTDE